jgi:hypothetical protein
MRGRSARTALSPQAGERVSSYPPGRECANSECTTVLSKYNASEFCFVHEPWRRGTGPRW